jgi:hypothetical protein
MLGATRRTEEYTKVTTAAATNGHALPHTLHAAREYSAGLRVESIANGAREIALAEGRGQPANIAMGPAVVQDGTPGNSR